MVQDLLQLLKKKLLLFMKAHYWTYYEPTQSNPHLHILFLKDPSNLLNSQMASSIDIF